MQLKSHPTAIKLLSIALVSWIDIQGKQPLSEKTELHQSQFLIWAYLLLFQELDVLDDCQGQERERS